MLTILNAVTALLIGVPVWVGAAALGQEAALCSVLKGKYDAKAKDHCEGGDWARVIPLLVSQPKQ
jgi:hypothetical protein